MRLLLSPVVLAASLLGQTSALTPKEAAEGWIQLFDGHTLFGWTPEGEATWQIRDGALVAESGGSGWLRSNNAFGDFVLKCEFRVGADHNSGIFVRSALQGAPHETGYEVQIWDGHEKFPTGSLVNHARARRVKLTPDRWHAYEIEANGDRFLVKLDGRRILEARDSKSRLGHFGLQYNKDKKIAFRNIALKPLNLKPIFNGKDLSGWKIVSPPKPPKEPAVWSVRNGALHVEKGGGQLETEQTWDDFVLQLDIRTNPRDGKHHPNSGVFFRGEPGAYWSGYESQIRNEFKEDPTQPVDWGTGAIYNRQAARRIVAQDGEYFTKTIVAKGRHMAVWINGYQVTDWEDTRPEGANARQQARLAAGTISLQAHDPTTNLDFRNLRLAPLK